LLVVDQDEEPASAERVERLFKLRFPIDRTVPFEVVLRAFAIQDALGIGRLNQPAEDELIALLVEVLHFLVDALRGSGCQQVATPFSRSNRNGGYRNDNPRRGTTQSDQTQRHRNGTPTSSAVAAACRSM
jgi:hypothetical protein